MSRSLFSFSFLSLVSSLLMTACNWHSANSGIKGTDQDTNLRQLSADERASDFDQLLVLFKTYYGPYQLKEQNLGISIEKVALELKAQALNAKTDEEFMGYVMQLGAALKDGHVQFQVENSSSNISRYRIPIALAPFQEKALVADIDKDLAKASGIKEGDEILSIDGKTPFELMKIGLKYRRTARDLSDEAFLLALALSRPSYMTELVPQGPLSEIKFQSAKGVIQAVNLPWTTDKYSTKLDSLVRPTIGLNLSVPYVDEFNSVVDSHRGQMGQVDPIFLNPGTQKTYGFIKVYPSDEARKKFGLADKETPPIYAALYKYEGKTILLVRQATYAPTDFTTAVYMKAYR